MLTDSRTDSNWLTPKGVSQSVSAGLLYRLSNPFMDHLAAGFLRPRSKGAFHQPEDDFASRQVSSI
jgi:hypothetical protein